MPSSSVRFSLAGNLEKSPMVFGLIISLAQKKDSTPDMRLEPHHYLCLWALLLVAVPAQGQDTLTVKGVTLTPGDSLEARELLRATLPPTSEFWAKRHSESHHYGATNTFTRIVEIAYPVDPDDPNSAHVDSILAYQEEVANRHPDSGTRAEFLYAALRLASGTSRDSVARRYYSRLTSEHGQSPYAQERADEYAPDRAIRADQPVPDFSFPTLQDSTQFHEKEDFRGQLVLIDFWGTWCGPCLGEMPHLHKAYQKYKEEGFTILSVAMKDTGKAVQGFRSNKWEMPWNHAFIPEGSAKEDSVTSRFEVRSYPKAVLVDEEGTIVATQGDLRGETLFETLSSFFSEGE